MNKLKPIRTDSEHKILIILAVVGIVIFGFYTRFEMITKTIVDHPIRADAADYYFYAFNLRHYGVYSKQQTDGTSDFSKKLVPDAVRPPGYSLFLLPFVEFPPTAEMVRHITFSQAVASAVTIFVAFGVFITFLSWPWAMAACLLLAMSPHLISMNVYVLTETLFTFLLVLSAWFMAKVASRKTWKWAFALGVILGCALLVKPTMKYFIVFLIPAFFLFFTRKQAIILLSAVIVGYSLAIGPWLIRNVVIEPGSTGNSLAVGSVHKGIYPGLMYKNNPRTYGLPNHYDPTWKERQEMGLVLRELLNRFREDPAQYLRWYLIGKPVMLFSWNMIVGIGDIFVYPIVSSSYYGSASFQLMHRIMGVLHWPLVILALTASILVWLPSIKNVLTEEMIVITRFVTVLFFYFLLIHVAGTPLPRYSIPLRPFIYGMGMLAVPIFITAIRSHFQTKLKSGR